MVAVKDEFFVEKCLTQMEWLNIIANYRLIASARLNLFIPNSKRRCIMQEPVIIKKTNRREVLKLSSMGVLGGMAANALTSGKAQAAEGPVNLSYASWIHGHSMQVEYPERLALHEHNGWGTDIEGKPGTENWFHFAIPTPVIINDVRLQADSILLSFRTGSIDAFVRDVHVYNGDETITEFNNVNLSQEQTLVRLVLPGTPTMGLGLGISLGVGFGVEPMDHTMTFFSAGCDFVIRPTA
jgi:hypothetical protein